MPEAFPYDKLTHRQRTHPQPLAREPFVKPKYPFCLEHLLCTVEHSIELWLTLLKVHHPCLDQVNWGGRASHCYARVERAQHMQWEALLEPAVSEDAVLDVIIRRQLHCCEEAASSYGWLHASVEAQEASLFVYLLCVPSQSFRLANICLHSDLEEVSWVSKHCTSQARAKASHSLKIEWSVLLFSSDHILVRLVETESDC